MMFEEILLLASASLFSISIYHVYMIRNAAREKRESVEILDNIAGEMRMRLDRQEKKLVEQDVRLDVTEAILRRLTPPIQADRAPVASVKSSDITSKAVEITSRQRVVEPGKKLVVSLTPTELEALKALKEGLTSAREIEDRLGRSREHTARLMKRLFEKGLVVRDDSKKPYVYKMTEEGVKASEGI